MTNNERIQANNAELPTTISNNSPFGATNATIVYCNSTTGEVISG